MAAIRESNAVLTNFYDEKGAIEKRFRS